MESLPKTILVDAYANTSPPDYEGLIDKDILKRFENAGGYYHGDILTAQLIKTNKELIAALDKLSDK